MLLPLVLFCVVLSWHGNFPHFTPFLLFSSSRSTPRRQLRFLSRESIYQNWDSHTNELQCNWRWGCAVSRQATNVDIQKLSFVLQLERDGSGASCRSICSQVSLLGWPVHSRCADKWDGRAGQLVFLVKWLCKSFSFAILHFKFVESGFFKMFFAISLQHQSILDFLLNFWERLCIFVFEFYSVSFVFSSWRMLNVVKEGKKVECEKTFWTVKLKRNCMLRVSILSVHSLGEITMLPTIRVFDINLYSSDCAMLIKWMFRQL